MSVEQPPAESDDDAPMPGQKPTTSGLMIWALAGAIAAFSVASLPTVGLIVALAIPFVVIAAIVLQKRGIEGALLGAGVVALVVGLMHLGGPGESCNEAGTACSEYLDPTLPLIIGAALLVVGGRIHLWRRFRAGHRPDLGGPPPSSLP